VLDTGVTAAVTGSFGINPSVTGGTMSQARELLFSFVTSSGSPTLSSPTGGFTLRDTAAGGAVVSASGSTTTKADLDGSLDKFTTAAEQPTTGGVMSTSRGWSMIIAGFKVFSSNQPPAITSDGGGASASLSKPENQTAVTDVDATDANAGDALTYSIVGGADASKFSIVASTGVLTFAIPPDFENPTDAGANNVYEVTVQVSDGNGGTDQQALSVTVTNVNESPMIISDGGDARASLSRPENQTAVTDVDATDPDAGQTLTYSIAGGDDASKLSIVAATGVLSFVTAPDFENPTDADLNNVYEVTVQASDGQGGTDQQDLSVTVTNVAENSPPAITSDGGGANANLSKPENQTAVTDVDATDPNAGDTLTYSIVNGADQTRFSIVASTGVLSFVTAPNFEAPTDANADNVYEVTVQVSDGNGGTDTQALSVTVTNVNESPSITSNGGGASANLSKPENQTAVTDVDATDQDTGDTLTYSIAGGSDALRFAIVPVTGVLSFLTPPDYENPTDANVDNVYEVTVQVSDGQGGTDQQALSVTVTDVNENSPPTIISDGGGPNANLSKPENQTAVTDVDAIDPDAGDTLTYSIVGGADQARFSIVASTGVLTFVTPPDFENPTDANADNVYQVTVEVSDGHGGTDQQALSVTVTDVAENSPPTIISDGGGPSANLSKPENQTAVTDVDATDPDAGDTLTYSIVGGADASRFSIVASTGVLSFVTAPNCGCERRQRVSGHGAGFGRKWGHGYAGLAGDGHQRQ
jgi:cadherin domain-containing protein/Big-like domain-containing protein